VEFYTSRFGSDLLSTNEDVEFVQGTEMGFFGGIKYGKSLTLA